MPVKQVPPNAAKVQAGVQCGLTIPMHLSLVAVLSSFPCSLTWLFGFERKDTYNYSCFTSTKLAPSVPEASLTGLPCRSATTAGGLEEAKAAAGSKAHGPICRSTRQMPPSRMLQVAGAWFCVGKSAGNRSPQNKDSPVVKIVIRSQGSELRLGEAPGGQKVAMCSLAGKASCDEPPKITAL